MRRANSEDAATLVEVDIGGPVSRGLADDERALSAARESVHADVASVMTELGVPSGLSVTVRAVDDALDRDRYLDVRVNGQRCRYAADLLWRAEALLDDTHPRYGHQPPSEWPSDRVVGFLALASKEIVKLRPRVFLDDRTLARYSERLDAGTTRSGDPLGASTLAEPLRTLLDLRIGIGQRDVVVETARKSSGAPAALLRERLIAALSADVLEITTPAELGKRLGSGHGSSTSDLLSFVAETLLTELGILAAPFRKAVDTALAVAVRVNSLRTLPWVSLGSHECLVNGGVDEIGGAVTGPGLNPATGRPAAVVPDDRRAELESEGWTTWDDAGYATLCLAEELRRNAACLVNQQKVDAQLDLLSSDAPRLVGEVRDHMDVAFVTGVLRRLVAERVSVRNLLVVLEHLLDARLELGTPGASRPDWEAVASARVRARLSRELASGTSRGTRTLVVYLLDEGLEEPLRAVPLETSMVPDDLAAPLVAALVSELQYLPLNAQVPHLLTMPDVRPHVHDAIRDVFPRIAVLSYDELPPGWNIMPVARVASV
jgi:FHIPEP family